MNATQTPPRFCIGDYSKFSEPQEANLACREWVKALTGSLRVKSEFHLPAADGKGEVAFTDLELVGRFAALSMPFQRKLLEFARACMAELQVTEVWICVPWKRVSLMKLLRFQYDERRSVLRIDSA